ncbi:MAG: sigma-70 family RNA polymerase sigma factor [Fuerstiella sp.]
MTEPENEVHLIQQLHAGNSAALAALIELYQPRLKRIIRFRLDHRLAGRISEADVIQEAYLNADKRIQHFIDQQEYPFFVWLRLIVNQTMVDLQRQHLHAQIRDVRKEISLERPGASAHTSLAMAAQLVAKVTSASKAFSRVERMATVEQALNHMEEIDREVIALRHFEELSNSEVAKVLGIDEQASSKRYVRAMKRMKVVLKNIPEFSDD